LNHLYQKKLHLEIINVFMETLVINGTLTTPEINFNAETGELLIKGISRPEDVLSFYKPVFDWINEYVKNPCESTTLNFRLKYHNSASAKIVCRIINLFDPLYKSGKKIVVKWYYAKTDEDILEAGEDYKSLTEVPFELAEI